jgi:hypothetical protein
LPNTTLNKWVRSKSIMPNVISLNVRFNCGFYRSCGQKDEGANGHVMLKENKKT